MGENSVDAGWPADLTWYKLLTDWGSVLGGIVGAGGAVSAVYLLIVRQRHEEANNASNAVRREIIGFSELVMSALRICECIKSGDVHVIRKTAQSIMTPPDPIVYRAVADRIGLLSDAQGMVSFYMRMVEIQQAVQIIVAGSLGDDSALVPGEEAETIAKSLIIACRLARAIISHVPGRGLDEQVSQITLAHIDAALESARRSFPYAEAESHPAG
jgi:hypothetical protein